jgi:cysteine-rich repeat protein
MNTRVWCFVILCVALAHSACTDGILEENEQCDDGNVYSSDGCSVDCYLENEAKFLCNTTLGMQTTCCPILRNPVTLEHVCNCESVEQPTREVGFTITPWCLKRDIDECNENNGNCLPGAICTNNDAVVHSEGQTHTCACLPGFVGDGWTMCVMVD